MRRAVENQYGSVQHAPEQQEPHNRQSRCTVVKAIAYDAGKKVPAVCVLYAQLFSPHRLLVYYFVVVKQRIHKKEQPPGVGGGIGEEADVRYFISLVTRGGAILLSLVVLHQHKPGGRWGIINIFSCQKHCIRASCNYIDAVTRLFPGLYHV
jgi:hypothetical protein